MNDNIAKTICTLGVWTTTAAILIWSDFGTLPPVPFIVLAAAGFSTASIWNYGISTKILRSGDEERQS